MRRIPPLTAVRAFEAASRHGNFTKAADELGMTQAAVSYQIKLLEERLGTQLFHRIKRQVSLTETGQRIAPIVSKAFDGLDDAFSIARTDGESVLTISCSNTFAANWFAVRLGGFQMQRPGLAVRLHTDDNIVDFARDEVDVAIRVSQHAWPGLVTHFLMRSPIIPLASPEFLARYPEMRTPEDVMQLPRLSSEDRWWNAWYEQVKGELPRTHGRAGIRFDSQIIEGRAAIAGQGIAVLNPALWRNDIEAGRLVPPLNRVGYGRGKYWLVYPEYRRNAPKVRAFREWLLAEMAEDAKWDPYDIYRDPDTDQSAAR